MQNIGERSGSQDELFRRFGEALTTDLRVAMPGIIQSFDAVKQTVIVKPAIRERIILDGQVQMMEIPLLLDVPIMIPRAGGYALTLPIQEGDDCLVIFSDMCIDAWWQSGGVQNPLERRRHDLSDAFAILGIWSQPRVIANYDTTKAALKHIASGTGIEISEDTVNLIGEHVLVNGNPIPTGE
jgi:hypothetical protein